MKCYPNLRQAIKIGFSIAKVMESHTLKSLPLFELKDKTYSKPYLLDIDNKQSSALIKELTPNNKFQHLTSKEHIKTTQNNTKNFYFNEVKNIQNRKGSASKNSSRDEDKMKTDFESLKKDLKNKNEEGSIMIEKEKLEKDKLPYIEENKILEKNSEKKNIFYQSFKSIQKRFSYRDQRVNKIELRNERIIKQLKLPKI